MLGAAAAGLLFCPAVARAQARAPALGRGLSVGAEFARAQAREGVGAKELLRAPKRALVLGNSRYPHAPLRNPPNDARAMAEVLKGVGFEVTLALESGRAAMLDAIRAYTEGLARAGAVGLFYFAGHGAQLAWRNYLLPLGEEIGDVEELRERGVDVNSLIEGLRRAGNPMNVIILDACRNNPFGSARRLDQKGLSQLDAPPGTLLAYATAPGHTASDGDGEHGLYTENLVRQIRVPEAKIEDVFKRVRLAVRRRSNGSQIPWESTSLEQDFWFVPPQPLLALATEEAERERREALAREEQRRAEQEVELRRKEELARLEQKRIAEEAERRRQQELAREEQRRAEEEAERRRREEAAKRAKPAEDLAERLFEEELALWERIKESREPGPLEDYLMRYPSGRFSELAQLRLDQVLAQLGEKKIQIVSAPENPYSKGTVTASTAYRVGDFYSYRRIDLLTKLEMERTRLAVTEITDTEVRYNGGRFVTDLLGNVLRFPQGSWSPNQMVPADFSVGKRWNTRFRIMLPGKGIDATVELELRIADRERIVVPAGTFNAFRVEARGWQTGIGWRPPGFVGGNWAILRWDRKVWYAPDQVRRPVLSEWLMFQANNAIVRSERDELVAFHQS